MRRYCCSPNACKPACAQGGLGEEGAGTHCVKDAKQVAWNQDSCHLLAVTMLKVFNLSHFLLCKMGMMHTLQSCWMIRGYIYKIAGTEQLLFIETLHCHY